MNPSTIQEMSFGVYSEVGQLNAVLLHRPGDELKRLTKSNHKKFLFDSIPCLTEAQLSHDLFAKYLNENHIEVFYVKDLFYETLEQSNDARQTFIEDLVNNSSHIKNKIVFKDWLRNRTNKELVDDIIVGVRYRIDELGDTISSQILCNENDNENQFLIPPLPNLVYIRGDIAYLGTNILLIGLSERTNKYAIETLLKTNLFQKIFVVKLPSQRVYMHLDMILSQVSRNIFTFHQPLQQNIEIFHLNKECEWISYGYDLPKALRVLLNCSLYFYDSIDEITSVDEQSHCRHNVFALCEHHVTTYDGDTDPIKSIYTQMINHKEHPCHVQLVRTIGLIEGGGGAHCITNPISRQQIH